MNKNNLQKVAHVFQIIGSISTFIFIFLSIFGVTQTQFPSVDGLVSYKITDTPIKVIAYSSLGIVALLSFIIAYIAKKSSKKKH